jgi:hypothetical protein
VSLDLPRIERAEDLGGAIGAVLQAASSGRLLLDEAAALVGMMESRRRVMEAVDLEQRLQALESESAGRGDRYKATRTSATRSWS